MKYFYPSCGPDLLEVIIRKLLQSCLSKFGRLKTLENFVQRIQLIRNNIYKKKITKIIQLKTMKANTKNIKCTTLYCI